MPWTVTVRASARVERLRFDQLDGALEALDARVNELSRMAAEHPLKTRLKRYDAVAQVFGRVELAGPQRLVPAVRAGVDVRGDGSIEAYMGRVRRTLIEERAKETALEAFRRSVREG